MVAFSSIAAVAGLAIGAFGAYQQYSGAKAQASAVKKENLARKQAADLQSRRNRRQSIREALLAGAQSQSAGSFQGMFGSVMSGANAGIQNTSARSQVNENQNQQIGAQINAAQTQYANAGTQMALGQGVQSIGGSIYNGSDSLGRVFNYATNNRYA